MTRLEGLHAATAPLLRGKFCEALESRPGRRIGAGEILYLPGDPATRSYYLRRGLVTTSLVSQEGGELIVGIHKPGDLIGEPCLPEAERTDLARALEESEIVEVSCADFVDHLQTDSEALLDFMHAMNGRLSELRAQLWSLARESVRLRLVRTLLTLADKLGEQTPEGARITHHLRQEDLAKMVGARREVVSRELNRLRREGAVRYSRGSIQIDLRALRELRDVFERAGDDIDCDL
ncbi:MAG TPA: Crp/Fnr family transcriptional regulator [Gemmatimonadota bacterium]|nr:Crp/Fnr family transcriptional regulator [Gemmatimonadota bacterium]